MDDTQASLNAADATRKRRSSILKNQRPPRTPFSEVEFNVATPTDTTKSRRVSFSRRTGVAEFITNEATTTWKNFYEEHNKSLESSANDSVANAPKQTVEHIGKRIFDEQFEEVVEIDFGGTVHANPLQEFQASFNNINLTQQLASLECMTEDIKFVASQSKFEQSAVTELSKPFGSEINVPILEDMTNPIGMNFSSMHSLGASDKCDDFDEIQKDLKGSKANGMCPGPISPYCFSGFIEVMDLNMTHGAIHKDELEMSTTNIITAPEVQEHSKSNISLQKAKSVDNDWINDKENIAINPYVAPNESQNFAVNKASDEVLVFDGKRLTTQSISTKIPEVEKENIHQTQLQKPVDCNDDLPNFIKSNSSVSNMKPLDDIHSTIEDGNKSITSAIDNQIRNNTVVSKNLDKNEKQNTIYETDEYNISFTQAVPSNIISTAKRIEEQAKDNIFDKTRNNTIHIDNMIEDISMTQAIPNNIIHLNEVKAENKNEKLTTIIFNDDSCDISMTQVIPTNINLNDKGNSDRNAPMKESIFIEKRKTIIFDNDSGNISMTQVLPTNIKLDKEESEYGTKVLTNENSKEISSKQKRKTIIFDDDSCNISMTQVLPTNIKIDKEESEYGTKVLTNENSKEISSKQKRKTIIFDDDSCNISMTQVLPTNIKLDKEESEYGTKVLTNENSKEIISKQKRKTIIFDDDSCNISMTQVLPTNIKLDKEESEYGTKVLTNENSKEIISKQKRKTIIFDDDSCNISMTQVLPTNIKLLNYEINKNLMNELPKETQTAKRKTIIFNEDACDISMTEVLPTNININTLKNLNVKTEINETKNMENRKTIKFENESFDVSNTQGIPLNIYVDEQVLMNNINASTTRKHAFEIENTQIFNLTDIDRQTKGTTENVIFQNRNPEKQKTVIFDNNLDDVSITQTVPPNVLTKIIEKKLDSNDLEVNSSNIENLNSDKRKSKINDLKNDLNELKQQILNQVQIDKSKIGDKNLTLEDDVDLTTASVKPDIFSNDEEIQCLRNETRNSMKPIFKENVFNNSNVIDNNINICNNIINMQNKIEIPQDVFLEKNNVITENAIQQDKSNFVVTDNIFKFEENEKTFHKRNIELRKSVSIYQIDTNEQPKQTFMDEIINDKSVEKEVNKSLKRGITTAAPSICDKSPIKFSNDDNDEHKKPDSHNEDTLQNSYVEKQMSVSQQCFSENICRSDSDIRSKPKKSILNELLDMSCESLEENLPVNRDIHVHSLKINDRVSERPESIQSEQSSEPNSRESYLIINSDSETVATNNSNKISDDQLEVPIKSRVSVICLQNEIQENKLVQKCNEFNDDIDMKDLDLSHKNTEQPKEHFKELNNSVNQEAEIRKHFDQSHESKYVRNADNTKDLLQMLSDFTDEGEESVTEEKHTQRTDLNPEKTNPLEKAEDMEEAIDYKNIKQESRRLSFAKKRQSIVISREDLLHNISMAKAVLQQSRFEVEESDMMDDTSDSMDTLEENELRNSNRMSSEVVKRLQFDDESASDASIETELKISPLKKTAFGETTYMNEGRATVIPTYIRDVSDDIKELMNDLVKPNCDFPFENVKHNLTSTCSTEIQANLMASSQIDIDVELVSNCESDYNMKENKSTIVDVKTISTQEFQKNVKEEMSVAEETPVNNILQKGLSPKITTTDEVIVFDHNNPLRNVLLPSIDCTNAHKYNPSLKDDTENAVQDSNDCTNEKIENRSLRQSMQYHMQVDQNTHSAEVELKKSRKSVLHTLDKKIPIEMKMQSGDAACENTPSITSCASKPLSMDRSVEGIATIVKDTEVNTLIAMKENKELLDQSSSLTLVDDRISDSECAINIPQSSEEDTKCQNLPVQILYKTENESEFTDKHSNVTSNEECSDKNYVEPKTRKRSYSPTQKDSCIPNIEVTPKPINKMQKMSNSPLSQSINKIHSDTNDNDTNEAKNVVKVLSINSSHTDIYNIDEHNKSNSKSSKLSQTIKFDADISTEFEGKKSVKSGFSSETDMQDPIVTVSQVLSSVASKISGFAEERISNNQITKESSSNMIEEINMLSFMGSSECEWDWSGGADTWAFRLLRGRLRLRTRLAHRHYDAVRTCVRADTPLLDVNVDVMQCEDKDSLIALCVDLAAEAMRYERSRIVSGAEGTVGGACAADVSALLRRCVAVARLARRWARVMRDARARLAYDIAPSGLIVLKVANIPLRCVWEVRMRVCVHVADARSEAYPRAADVCVAPALAVRAPAPASLARLTAAQPADWGHAPRTLWKVFRYLKNRTKDEDLLGL